MSRTLRYDSSTLMLEKMNSEISRAIASIWMLILLEFMMLELLRSNVDTIQTRALISLVQNDTIRVKPVHGSPSQYKNSK